MTEIFVRSFTYPQRTTAVVDYLRCRGDERAIDITYAISGENGGVPFLAAMTPTQASPNDPVVDRQVGLGSGYGIHLYNGATPVTGTFGGTFYLKCARDAS
jgi:hypothetical protein